MLQAEEQPQEGGRLVEQLALQITDLESADRSLTQRIEDCLEKLTRAQEQVGNRERTLEAARSQVQELRHQLAVCSRPRCCSGSRCSGSGIVDRGRA